MDIVIVIPTVDECTCCFKIDTTIQKVEQIQSHIKITCITKDEAFELVCLNVWVLQAGYFTYRQYYDTQNIQHYV